MGNDIDDLLKRRGYFELDVRRVLGDISFWGRVMSKVLVTKCEHGFHNNRLYYHAYSELFRKVKDQEESPYYEIRSNEFNDIEAIELPTPPIMARSK
jgi:hypothetical protein